MTNAYILTEKGRTYNKDGTEYVLNQIRTTFNDHSDVNLSEGMLYNRPDVLAEFLSRDPEHSYVFVSHGKGIEILYAADDINRFIGLLKGNTDKNETSWSIIMKALGLR